MVITQNAFFLSYIAGYLPDIMRNKPLFGFLIGILLPLLGFVIMYIMWGNGLSFGRFLSVLKENNKSFGKVLTMSVLVNLIPFVYFNVKRRDYAMNGVVIATMLYAVLIVLIMFVW